MPRRPLVVMIRGPMGAGKTTLMRGLARRRRYRFWVLDTDAATAALPPDFYGEHLEDEWPVEQRILALYAKVILGRGLNLLLDPGILLNARNVDHFLRRIGRDRREARVILFRLTVPVEEAVRRKTTVQPRYVRASNLGWQPGPVTGEIVIDTAGRSAREVLALAERALRARSGGPIRETQVRLPRSPLRRPKRSTTARPA